MLPAKSILKIIGSLCIILLCYCNRSPTEPQFASLQEEIESIVNEYLEIGMAVGIIDKQQQETRLYYGSKTRNQEDPPDGNTVFQIGSITKTFTGILLADRILNGTIGINENAGDYLPAGMTMPSAEGVEITIKHLATHASGIPKRPHNTGYPAPPGYDPVNSYAAYTAEHIYDYLTNYCTLLFTPGTGYNYSNIGAGLIGHICGLLDGSSYDEVITETILTPLGLNNTSITMTPAQATNSAMGYGTNFDARPDWDANDIFQGAGWIRSSLNDMMHYLKINLGMEQSPLDAAVALTHQTHFNVGTVTYDDRPGEVYELGIGFFWQKLANDDGFTYYRHGGKTNAHFAYIGFDETKTFGTVILGNYEGTDGLQIGYEIMSAINRY